MSRHRVEQTIAEYVVEVKRQNTEEARKLRFQSLVTSLFRDSPDAVRVIHEMARGAEKRIRIPLPDRIKQGRADTVFNDIIIEWERDLAKTGEHAKDQLAEYVHGVLSRNEHYDYTLIATDGAEWRIYAPDVEALLRGAKPDRLALKEVDRFQIGAGPERDFYYFLDRYLFKTTRRKATLDSIQQDFGEYSAAFINAVRGMQSYLGDFEANGEVSTAFREWQRFLQIAYGRFNDSRRMFFVHTYLSAFAKLLAYAVLDRDRFVEDALLKDILSGKAFDKLNVERFVEGDFFHWVSAAPHFDALKSVFRDVLQRIAEYDFKEVDEDILKGVYQELIDLDTRHQLGEYYTPDWLCEKIVAELPIEKDSHVLDPACGSGSFLRAVIARLRSEYKGLSAAQIAEQVVGIDIHPLSVQISKTTVLLALGEQLRHAKRPIALQVYLANSLFVARDANLAGTVFQVRVDGHRHAIDLAPLMDHPTDFDEAVSMCQDFIDRHVDKEVDAATFERAMRAPRMRGTISKHTAGEFYVLYKAMRAACLAGRDSIWKFVLQNLYKPVFLRQAFDVVVGNPPWLTYADVTNADYQEELDELAGEYSMRPASKANMPHLEIAALFLAHSASYYLKDGGALAFVMPRSFLNAGQHDNTRSGEATGFKLEQIWDLADVSPLFNVPCCVLFAAAYHDCTQSASLRRPIGKSGIVGKRIVGRLGREQLHWAEAAERLSEQDVRWFYSRMSSGTKSRTALTNERISKSEGGNWYASRFKQGATIVPRNFYFVELEQEAPDLEDRVVQVRTSRVTLPEAKPPWKAFTLAGRVHTRYLFRTALAKNILPFTMVNPPLVLLPIEIDERDGEKRIVLVAPELMFQRGEAETSRWFEGASELWDKHRTENNKGKNINLWAWLDWQNKLTGQNLAFNQIVVYTAAGKDASASVIDRRNLDKPFIADHKTYLYTCESQREASFVAAYLNSGYVNSKIKDFQSRGLFGPRDVHKTVLAIPFPEFDPVNPDHLTLSGLGVEASKAAHRITGSDPALDLDPNALGRLRRKIRVDLAELFKLIDQLVEAISSGTRPVRDDDPWSRLTNPFASPHNKRTREDIDAQVQAEREAWEK